MPKTTEPKKRGFDDPTVLIRSAIIEGKFLPNERLVEEDLVPRFNANRSAVRLALARLEQEGLIIREPNRGARVRLVSGKEAIEIMETRAVLESLIIRHAAQKVTDQQIKALKAILAELRTCVDNHDMDAYVEGNRRLHEAIVEIGDHATSSKLLHALSGQSVISQFRPFLEPGRPEDLLREHEELVAALAKRDPDKVEHLMRAHLDKATEVVRNRMHKAEAGEERPRRTGT